MNNRYDARRLLVTLAAVFAFGLVAAPSPARAQIEWNGTLDLAAGFGGGNSTFVTNELPRKYDRAHISIDQFNLILFAPVDEEFSVEARLRADTWGTGTLHAPRLALGVLNWTPVDRLVSLSLGRFVTPFGLHPSHQLPMDRTFIAAPLAYGYFTNISGIRGFWTSAGQTGNYGVDDVGVTTVNYEGLSTGLQMTWTIRPEETDLQLALTDAAPCSPEPWTDQFNGALVGRFGWHPRDDWYQGISFAYGSFMQQETTLLPLLKNPPKYRQLLIGTDWTTTTGALTVKGELLYSHWNVPVFDSTTFLVDSAKAVNVPLEVSPSLWSGYIDGRLDFGLAYGSYLAVRLETIQFLQISDPLTGGTIDWDRDVIRWSFAGGMKISPSILGKIAYTNQAGRSEHPALKDWTIRAMMSVVF